MDEKDELSIRQVANSIVDALKYPGQAVFENEAKDNGQDRKPASNQKLIELIGPDFKFTPFDVGLYPVLLVAHALLMSYFSPEGECRMVPGEPLEC